MSDLFKEVKKDGFILRVFYDNDNATSNPRDDDNLGTMICWSNRHSIGDSHKYETRREFWEDLANDLGIEYTDQTPTNKLWVTVQEKCLVLPVFLLDHSGITISNSPFNDSWDSGLVGYVYAKYEDIKKCYGEVDLNKATKCLQAETKTYDQYLTGDVYGYIMLQETKCECCGQTKEEELDSCWGFYGTDWNENGLADNIGTDNKFLVDLL